MAKPYPYFVSLDEAINLCQKTEIKLESESIPISESLNRVVSNEIYSKINDPGFDNSAMDGFAVMHSDTLSPPTQLSIIGSSMAGTTTIQKIVSGQAVRIMTGAPIPAGADSIIPIEDCTVLGNEVTLNKPSRPNFIRKQGENFSINQIIFTPGEIMSPEKISLCAAAGISTISVFKKLKIAVISTGDELKSLDENLKFGQIYESNSYGLSALVDIYGHEATRFTNVVDNLVILRETLNEASKNHDCIITSGGVSMGDKDYVRILMEQEGDIKFWRVKMRPGSPPIFGLWNDKPIFGLPGNPVSSHVVFRAIVGKWLTSLTNSKDINTKYTYAILDEDIKTQEGFTTFRRVELFSKDNSTFARLKSHQGSGNIAGIAMSDGLTVIEPDQLGRKGDVCKIILL